MIIWGVWMARKEWAVSANCEFLPAHCLCEFHACLGLSETKMWCQICGIRSYRQLGTAVWVLWTKLGFSARAGSAPNHWTIYPVPAVTSFLHGSSFPVEKSQSIGTSVFWKTISLLIPKTGFIYQEQSTWKLLLSVICDIFLVVLEKQDAVVTESGIRGVRKCKGPWNPLK